MTLVPCPPQIPKPQTLKTERIPRGWCGQEPEEACRVSLLLLSSTRLESDAAAIVRDGAMVVVLIKVKSGSSEEVSCVLLHPSSGFVGFDKFDPKEVLGYV